MRESFGELILKKDSILYCKTSSSYNDIIQKKQINEYFLYNLYFHPSQIRFLENLFKVRLKKDISLFCNFEINFWENNNFNIIDLFKKLPNGNKLYRLLNTKLKEHHFDGFITPQFGYAKNFEITLFNDDSIFEMEKLENIENWDNKNILECFGTFPICFTYSKPIFNLNRCYEKKINSCINYYKNNNEIKPKSNGFFYLLFIYSDINYYDFEEKNIYDVLLNDNK